MRVTTKGQVTIPQHIRDKLGIGPSSEVEFVEEEGRVVLQKREDTGGPGSRSMFAGLRGAATVKMTTDEIMALTRSDE